jgi:type II secretory pathway pseudopilin PulG
VAELPRDHDEPEPAWPPLVGWFGCVLALATLALGALIWGGSLAKQFDQDGTAPKVLADLKTIADALEEYAARHAGGYPSDLEALVTPDERGDRYLQSTHVPRDPWRSPYAYRPASGSNSKPIVFSLGMDGLPGTSDDIQAQSAVK